MYQLKKNIFDFLPKYCKNVIFGHFSAPWGAPLYLKSMFSFTYIRKNMQEYSFRVFNHCYITINQIFFVFCQNIEKKSFLATLAPPRLLPYSQNLIFFPQIYSLAHVEILIEVFLLLYERNRKLFFWFLSKQCKKCGFWSLQRPLGYPPLPKKLEFFFRYIEEGNWEQ